MATELAVVYKLIAWVGGGFTALVGGHLWWFSGMKKSIETRLDKVEEKSTELHLKQTTHESIFVTEQRTREVIREEIEPLKEDTLEIKGSVKIISEKLGDLISEMRIINAVKQDRER